VISKNCLFLDTIIHIIFLFRQAAAKLREYIANLPSITGHVCGLSKVLFLSRSQAKGNNFAISGSPRPKQP